MNRHPGPWHADPQSDGRSPAPESPDAGGPGFGGEVSERSAADEGETWIDDVRGTLSGLLGHGSYRIQDLAAACGMSVRTLQRRLAEAGLTYSRLLDEIRLAEARRGLTQTGALLRQVAANLGFCEPASFTRACRRWTGLSPREYQRQLQTCDQLRSGAERV